jgi:hypothetical protein
LCGYAREGSPRHLIRRLCSASLCWIALALCQQPALASSFSQAQVSISPPFPSPNISASTLGADVVSVSDGAATLSAQSVIATGSVGLQLDLPTGGDGNSLRASAQWADNWTGASSLSPTVPVAATITLDGSIDSDFYNAWLNGTTWTSSFSLTFHYDAGGHTFELGIGADDTPASIRAFFDRTDITANLICTPDAADPTKTHFSMSYASPAFAVDSSGFFDDLVLSYQGDGQPPAFDAIHTFSTRLGSTDPTVSFISDSGRAFGIPAPEPSTAVLAVIALGAAVMRRPGVSRD